MSETIIPIPGFSMVKLTMDDDYTYAFLYYRRESSTGDGTTLQLPVDIAKEVVKNQSYHAIVDDVIRLAQADVVRANYERQAFEEKYKAECEQHKNTKALLSQSYSVLSIVALIGGDASTNQLSQEILLRVRGLIGQIEAAFHRSG